MINLGLRLPTPNYLTRETVSSKKRQLKVRIDGGEKLSSQDFDSYWRSKSVRKPLWTVHHGKCAYCERRRDMTRDSDIEHYRPKTEVTEDQNHPGYWWLAYEWTNYLISCKRCNQQYKMNKFPLLPRSPRASRPEDDISSERPVLLNPFDDDPETCVTFDWERGAGVYVTAIGTDEDGRGAGTIQIVGLNDPQLMEERAENLRLLENLAQSMKNATSNGDRVSAESLADEIRDATSANKSFAGFRRAFFRNAGLAKYMAAE